jgi:hypothetical protein
VGFEKRRIDAGWQVGSLQESVRAPEPEPEGEDVAALLDEAEGIVNSAAPEIIADIDQKQSKRRFRKKNKMRRR